MKKVYLTENPDQITSNDLVKRQGFTVREAKSLGFEDEGFYVYLKGSKDFFEQIEEALKGSKLVEEEKAKKIIKKMLEEEERGIAGASILG